MKNQFIYWFPINYISVLVVHYRLICLIRDWKMKIVESLFFLGLTKPDKLSFHILKPGRHL